ncbi:hypothetical protein HPB52_025214 [Rhipicephalus sanguineus]|uniref:Uncharacterized protein n=1 Tax=Rhipicephalus sanguineus TaxID=34632 RepID=A0A9D4TD47_RHISA|nr:hypothetical protein HPB52_025387 [Rhipicephalus sanguineus]KAH7986087.1 hypothetical protein HPB52_025214 [Rhipicephalus sanguineus]
MLREFVFFVHCITIDYSFPVSSAVVTSCVVLVFPFLHGRPFAIPRLLRLFVAVVAVNVRISNAHLVHFRVFFVACVLRGLHITASPIVVSLVLPFLLLLNLTVCSIGCSFLVRNVVSTRGVCTHGVRRHADLGDLPLAGPTLTGLLLAASEVIGFVPGEHLGSKTFPETWARESPRRTIPPPVFQPLFG